MELAVAVDAKQALCSQNEMLWKDLATNDSMVASYVARLQHRTAKIIELELRLQSSLSESDKVPKSSEDWTSKYICSICTSAEADSLTECGHLFCKGCLNEGNGEWYWRRILNGDIQGIMQHVMPCPICRKGVVMSEVKHVYQS